MKLVIRDEFQKDYISRQAGERLRNLILSALEKDKKIELDFSGMIVGSVSFFDEGIAKLIDHEINSSKFKSNVKLTSIDSKDRNLLQSLCQKRGWSL